jgi:hypothetical protein
MIAGLQGREPIGAVLTIGHKGPTGAPTDTDRLFIVVPQEVDGVRPPHPQFAAFNAAPAEKRTALRGVLVHAAAEDCWTYSRRAQLIQKPAHPNMRPQCSCEDGVTAHRWVLGGAPDAFEAMPCPGDRCQFAQSDGSRPPPCKPFLRFLFRPVWAANSPLPTPLMKYTSGGWNTAANFLGFFCYIKAQARQLGVERPNLYGLPFSLALVRKKRRGESGGRAFPVMTITPDVDLQSFLYAQGQHLAQLQAGSLPALTVDDEPPEVIDADFRSINPTRSTVPADQE